MTKVFSLLGFAAELTAIEKNMRTLGPRIIEKAAQMVAAEAKKRIGRQNDWPPLSPATIADRVKHGFAPNQPGLRTGAMRDSIEITIAPSGLEAEVGSNDPHLLWFELGTSRQPPRSVLVAAAQSSERRIYDMAARAVVAVLEGRGLHSSEFFELLHLLREVGHELKETGAALVGQGDENKENRR
jgi:Bacteriophage HK97-gp10, putative tail-component